MSAMLFWVDSPRLLAIVENTIHSDLSELCYLGNVGRRVSGINQNCDG